jgi:hypothetical protein
MPGHLWLPDVRRWPACRRARADIIGFERLSNIEVRALACRMGPEHLSLGGDMLRDIRLTTVLILSLAGCEAHERPEECNDRLDNDRDLQWDAEDPDCIGVEAPGEATDEAGLAQAEPRAASRPA